MTAAEIAVGDLVSYDAISGGTRAGHVTRIYREAVGSDRSGGIRFAEWAIVMLGDGERHVRTYALTVVPTTSFTDPGDGRTIVVNSVRRAHYDCEQCDANAASAYDFARVTGSLGSTYITGTADDEHEASVTLARITDSHGVRRTI